MPYYARRHQLTGSLIYHVFNRSATQEPIFHIEEDFQHFMDSLRGYKEKFLLKIYHWVIMNTHFHILLEIADPREISSLMAGIARAYTHYHHKIYGTRGFLWQGRFKLQPVQKERYLIACGRYIERNPVRANIAQEAHDYPYSSARFYCKGLCDGITSQDPIHALFGLENLKRQLNYVEFLRDFNAEEEELFNNFERPVGDEAFIRLLRKLHGRHMPQTQGRSLRIFCSQHSPNE